jgi:WD40 repeat protein
MVLQSILELNIKETLSDYVTAIAWSPRGSTLAASSGAGEVILLKKFVRLSLRQSTDQSIDCLAFSFDGKLLAAGGQDGTVILWQMNEVPQMIDILECGSTWIDRLTWHPTRNYLAFNQNKAVQIWDADDAEIITTLAIAGNAQDIRWSPDGKYLAIAAKSNIYIWKTHSWNAPLYQWELPAAGMAIAWSPDGTYLASANQDNTLSILEWAKIKHLNHEPIYEDEFPTLMRGFPGKVRRLAWSDLPPTADLPPILAAATREVITMWMPTSDDWESWVLDLHSSNVLDVAFQPNSGFLASLSEDGWIILWQAALEAAQVIEGVAERLSCLAWHPTGKHLAAGGQQGELLVWSIGRTK